MKKLQNLKGAKALNKKEQQSINGGAGGCLSMNECFGTCSAQCQQWAVWNPQTGEFDMCYHCVPFGEGGPQ